MEHERILCIYDYLCRYTNESRMASIQEIQEHLAANTGLSTVSALTIRRDIERLTAMGNDIRRKNGPHNTAYYGLVGQGFTFNEIRFIVDSISINRFLSPMQKQKLIKKFEGMCSAAEVRQLISRISLNGQGLSSLDLLENLDQVHCIISENRKIHFDYGKFNTERQMVYYSKRRDLIPVRVVYFNERFYLKCVNAETQESRTYRIDRMKNITAGDKVKKRPELPKPDGIVLDMFEPDYFESVELRVRRFLLDDMLEQLGDAARVKKESGNTGYVSVRATIGISPGFFSWVLRYGSDVEIVSPKNVRCAFQEKLKTMCSLYQEKNA
ncbi:MAG: WYL domain-containing protein [Ruminococcus sp.]|nr:WYL domain-containing protein [Ruminococcus sp.]